MPQRVEDYGLIGDTQTAALVGRGRLHRLAWEPGLACRRRPAVSRIPRGHDVVHVHERRRELTPFTFQVHGARQYTCWRITSSSRACRATSTPASAWT